MTEHWEKKALLGAAADPNESVCCPFGPCHAKTLVVKRIDLPGHWVRAHSVRVFVCTMCKVRLTYPMATAHFAVNHTGMKESIGKYLLPDLVDGPAPVSREEKKRRNQFHRDCDNSPHISVCYALTQAALRAEYFKAWEMIQRLQTTGDLRVVDVAPVTPEVTPPVQWRRSQLPTAPSMLSTPCPRLAQSAPSWCASRRCAT